MRYLLDLAGRDLRKGCRPYYYMSQKLYNDPRIFPQELPFGIIRGLSCRHPLGAARATGKGTLPHKRVSVQIL